MVLLGVVFLVSLLHAVLADINILLKPGKRCIPTASQVGVCHVCMCTVEGILHCHSIKCNALSNASGDTNSKLSESKHTLPEIHEGEPCLPGLLYKLECNTCRCTQGQTLLCTRMACIDSKNRDKKEHEKNVLRDDAGDNTNISREGKKKAVIKKQAVKKSFLPKVQKGEVCKPGKIYRSYCKRCFCTAKKQIVCSKKKEACTFDKRGKAPPIQTAEDVHPPMQPTEVELLPQLQSTSERCHPGLLYKVDCNYCVCMESYNLVCQKKICVSFEDMNRIAAKEMSGKKCNGKRVAKDCIVCTCEFGMTKCKPISECTARQYIGTNGHLLVDLDPNDGSIACVPLAVYKTDCNKCYCQKDGSLRCTQKICLNYSQVKKLEEQREYLERHGL